MDWRERALCRDEPDLEIFFPIGTTGPAALQTEEAKGVCRRCGVCSDCLDWALGHRDEAGAGIWGATTEQERRAMARRTVWTA